MTRSARISLWSACLVASTLFLSCGTDFLFEELEPPRDITIPAPTGLTATDGTLMARIRLTWLATPEAVTYQVFRSNLPEGGAFTMVASNLPSATWDDTNTVANYPFYYKVAFLTATSNQSELSTTARGMSLPWQAPAPLDVQARAGSSEDRVRISFSAGSNTTAVSWVIYTAPGEDAPYSPIATIPATNTTSMETGSLDRGMTHFFRVVGLDAGGTASQVSRAASWAIPPALALPAPTALTASSGTDNTGITLAWTGAPGADGYRIYRTSATNTGYQLVAGVPTSPWKDTNAIAPDRFLYRISATNSSEESLAHQPVEGWRGYGPWNGATILSASDGSTSSGILLTWLPVPGASSYTVFRGTSSGGPWTQIAGPLAATTWLDESTAYATHFWYRAVAIREDGAAGPPSPADEGFRAFEDAPPAPTGVTGINGGIDTHKVTWNSMGVAKYRVYKSDNYDGPWSLEAEQTSTTWSSWSAFSRYWGVFYRISCLSASGKESPLSQPVQSAAWSGINAPEMLSASQGLSRSRVTISWSKAWNPNKYWVFRAPSPEGPWMNISGDLSTNVQTYTDPIESGVWFYRLKAESFIGYDSGYSATATGYPIPWPALQPPLHISSANQAAGSEVLLAWEEVNQAAGYRVYRSREEHGLYSDVSGIVTGTSWVNTGITPGAVWYYKISTVNPAGKTGPLSPPVNNRIQLAAPGSAMASDGTLVNKVAVLWSSVSGADHYRVYRAAAADGVSLCISPPVPAGSTQYMDETPLPGTGWYRVAAFDSAGNPGLVSAADAGIPKAVPVPNPPASLVASDGTSTNGVALSWQPSADAAWYRVARATRADGDYVFISPPLTNCEFVDSSAPAKEFFYKVAAFNADGLSGLLSPADKGHKGLSDMDFLIAFDTTIASSHKKMTLMHNDGMDALGKEIKNGTVAGQVLYNAAVAGLGANIVFTYAGYRDEYLVLDGAYTVHASMDKSGTIDGTVTVSSPVYAGTVRYALVVTGGNASGGYWFVRQQGAPVETQIAWFPSPSSQLE